jgi:putative transposase
MERTPHSRTLRDQTFFVTTSTLNRKPVFASDVAAEIVLNTLQFFRQRKEIELYGYVIMPDHVHLALRVAEPLTLPNLMRRFKSFVARAVGQGEIWEKGYWSQAIPAEAVLVQKLRYMMRNPVEEGFCEEVEHYR